MSLQVNAPMRSAPSSRPQHAGSEPPPDDGFAPPRPVAGLAPSAFVSGPDTWSFCGIHWRPRRWQCLLSARNTAASIRPSVWLPGLTPLRNSCSVLVDTESGAPRPSHAPSRSFTSSELTSIISFLVYLNVLNFIIVFLLKKD